MELHRRFGGSGQNGISPSARTPNIMIFTSESGRLHGYYDEWSEDGTFHYTGEGQQGDQQFIAGNRALRDHANQGRAIRLFEGARGVVRYVGEFVLSPDTAWSYGRAPATGGGPERQVIRFHLVPVERGTERQDLPIGTSYRAADESVQPAQAQPGTTDPDLAGRNLRAHRHLQNELADYIQSRGIHPLSPTPTDPDFDLAWRSPDGRLVVCEVKSLTRGNEIHQLRVGLGQVLDYADRLQRRGQDVSTVLWVERAPLDARWSELLLKVGVQLGWPGLESTIA